MVFGLAMAAAFIIALPDPIKNAGDGGNIIFNMMAGLAVPVVLKDVLYIGIVLANFLCALAGVTSPPRAWSMRLRAMAGCRAANG